MKLGIFTSRDDYESDRLMIEATEVGIDVEMFDRAKLSFVFDNRGPKLFYNKKLVDDLHAAVFRIGPPQNDLSKVSLIEQLYIAVEWLVDLNIRVLNGDSIKAQKRWSKLWQVLQLSHHNIPLVPAEAFGDLDEMPETYFDEKKVIKDIVGTRGVGVSLVTSQAEARRLVARIGMGKFMFQQYYPGGVDYRVLVLGEKCLGAMKRTAPKGDFRSNVSQGGKAEVVKLTREMKHLALSAAKVLGVEYCGVDLYPVKGELRVLEVNRFAQFQGFEKATGINVARKIVEFLIAKKA